MNEKLFTPDSAHWYDSLGRPVHQIQAKAGHMRPTTLADARKLNLYPSVTNVLQIMAKPELEAWKLTQAVLAALTLPRAPGEDDDTFARRVVEDSQAQASKAADFGSSLHRCAGWVWTADLANQNWQEEPAAAWIPYIEAWKAANVEEYIWHERSAADKDLGYAGTADLFIRHKTAGLMLLDLKTQAVKDGKPRAYDEWLYQLAAYRASHLHTIYPFPMVANLIFDSQKPGPGELCIWTKEKVEIGWNIFHHCLDLWQLRKNYKPANQNEI